MSLDLLGLLKNQLTSDMVGKIAGAIGESPGATQNALGGALPALLGGVIQKASSTDGASALFGMLGAGKHDGGILDDLAGALGGGGATQNLMSAGSGLLGTLLGGNSGGIAELIARTSGIKSSSATSLLGLAAPLVMGLLGRTVKTQGITSAAGLASMLMGQKSLVQNALPAGLGNLLGMVGAGSAPAMAAAAPSSSGGNRMLWLLPLAAIAIGYLMFGKGCQKPPAITDATQAIDSTASQAADAMADWFKKTLPGGVALSAPMGGIENKLVDFIEDGSRAVDKTTWFDFDRLTFETGSATLDMAKSAEQLGNVAAIMKAYPAVEVKIGGYTDNVGNAAANMKLSEARAKATLAELVKLGVAEARMNAEGYGDQHPVASNDTEEGRAQNRRIAMRVTKK